MGVRYFFISLVKPKIENKMSKTLRSTNSIHLAAVKGRRRQAMLGISSELCKGHSIKYLVKENKIILRNATIDDRGTVTPHPRISSGKITMYTFEVCLGDEDWAFGEYLIDEDETNEDQIVFYKEDLTGV